MLCWRVRFVPADGVGHVLLPIRLLCSSHNLPFLLSPSKQQNSSRQLNNNLKSEIQKYTEQNTETHRYILEVRYATFLCEHDHICDQTLRLLLRFIADDAVIV